MSVNTLIFSLAAATLFSTPSAAATSGELSILTMNVAGLPAIFNSNDVTGDKATNAGTIGTYFAEYGYDMIHVQEVYLPTAAYEDSIDKYRISITMHTSMLRMIMHTELPLLAVLLSAVDSTHLQTSTGSTSPGQRGTPALTTPVAIA